MKFPQIDLDQLSKSVSRKSGLPAVWARKLLCLALDRGSPSNGQWAVHREIDQEDKKAGLITPFRPLFAFSGRFRDRSVTAELRLRT